MKTSTDAGRVERIAGLSGMYMTGGESLACGEGESRQWDGRDGFSLLLLTAGAAVCLAGGVEYGLARGDCLLLPPDVPLRVLGGRAGPIAAVRIAFAFSQPQPADPDGFSPAAHLPLGRAVRVKPLPRMRADAEALCRPAGGDPRGELDKLRAHIAFLRLVGRVLEQSGQGEPGEPGGPPAAADSVAAVKASITYLQEHYDKEHAVGQLAKSANLGVRQYTRLFKRLTGRTPIDYLHEYRINRSREQLLQGNHPLWRISRNVGVEDAHYFNRLFKTAVGCSPREYVRRRNLDSRIVTIHYAGEMLALGLSPLGDLDITLNQIQGDIGRAVSIGEASPDPRRVSRLRPDLIVASDFMGGEELSALQGIAPVIVVPWDMRPFERLQRIAAVLGKEAAAEAWLARYDAKRRQAMAWCGERATGAETAAMLRLDEGKVWVHASRFFPTFYEVMGFQPCAWMRGRIEAPDQPRRAALPFDGLAELDADRLYVINGRTPAYRGWIDELLRTDAWRELRAVRRNRAYLLGYRGISYDAGTLEWQLGEIERLWEQPPAGAAATGWPMPFPHAAGSRD